MTRGTGLIPYIHLSLRRGSLFDDYGQMHTLLVMAGEVAGELELTGGVGLGEGEVEGFRSARREVGFFDVSEGHLVHLFHIHLAGLDGLDEHDLVGDRALVGDLEVVGDADLEGGERGLETEIVGGDLDGDGAALPGLSAGTGGQGEEER